MHRTKYFVGQIDERNGEREYSSTVKFIMSGKTAPDVILDAIAKTWYAEGHDETFTDDGYYFNGGEVCVSAGIHEEVESEIYSRLPSFITELTGARHGE